MLYGTDFTPVGIVQAKGDCQRIDAGVRSRYASIFNEWCRDKQPIMRGKVLSEVNTSAQQTWSKVLCNAVLFGHADWLNGGATMPTDGLPAATVKACLDIVYEYESNGDTTTADDDDNNGDDKPVSSKSKSSAARSKAELLAELLGGGIDEERVQQIVELHVQKLAIPRDVHLHVGDAKSRVLEFTHDEKLIEPFTQVCEAVAAGERVQLIGPSGCGKSRMAEMVARKLKQRYVCVSFNADKTASSIIGRRDHIDRTYFWETEFLDFYENGGLVCFDEYDAALPEVAIATNAALGDVHGKTKLRTDDGRDREQHGDFNLIATTNTIGHGATRDYSARQKLDGAMLDRFTARFRVDYPYDYERALAKQCKATDIVGWLHGLREKVRTNNIDDAIVSTRQIIMACERTARGVPQENIKYMFLAGWDDATIDKVGEKLPKLVKIDDYAEGK